MRNCLLDGATVADPAMEHGLREQHGVQSETSHSPAAVIRPTSARVLHRPPDTLPSPHPGQRVAPGRQPLEARPASSAQQRCLRLYRATCFSRDQAIGRPEPCVESKHLEREAGWERTV